MRCCSLSRGALVATLVAARLLAQQPAQQSSAAIDPRVALSDSAIRAIIKDRVDAKRSAGIVVGVLDSDGRTRVFGYGASGTGRPLDANSVFEIGSITKTFTQDRRRPGELHGRLVRQDHGTRAAPGRPAFAREEGEVMARGAGRGAAKRLGRRESNSWNCSAIHANLSAGVQPPQ